MKINFRLAPRLGLQSSNIWRIGMRHYRIPFNLSRLSRLSNKAMYPWKVSFKTFRLRMITVSRRNSRFSDTAIRWLRRRSSYTILLRFCYCFISLSTLRLRNPLPVSRQGGWMSIVNSQRRLPTMPTHYVVFAWVDPTTWFECT